MNKKIIITIIVLLGVAAAAGFYFFLNKQVGTEDRASLTTTTQRQGVWKTYQNQELGFSIKYPPEYSIEVNSSFTGSDWMSADFISIFDPKDTSTNEFHVIPVHIVLQRQPVTYGGQIYRTVRDYIQSDEYTKGEASNSKDRDTLITVNGEEAIHHHSLQGDAEDASVDSYSFIKNDLIYLIFLNAKDPYREQILQSITFLKNS